VKIVWKQYNQPLERIAGSRGDSLCGVGKGLFDSVARNFSSYRWAFQNGKIEKVINE
jgi:hypothetical protein